METTDEVLLLDDDPTMLDLLEGILVSAGFVCRRSDDAEKALSQIVSAKQISLVVSDLCMPGLTGLDFIERLNQLPLDRPAPRVLLLTARPSFDSAVDALRLGARDFLIKPISPGKLIEAVRRGLSAARTERTELAAHQQEVRELMRQAEAFTHRLRTLTDSGITPPDEPSGSRPGSATGGNTLPAADAAGIRARFAEDPVAEPGTVRIGASTQLSVLLTIDHLRRLRTRYESHQLDEIGWHLLLELLRAELERQRLSVSALSMAVSGVSTATALRRISELVSRGYIDRTPDPKDGRRDFVGLTSRSRGLLTDFLAQATSELSEFFPATKVRHTD